MSESPQSKGGKNRALALSGEERRRVAQHAANVRWGAPDADIKYVHAVVDADIKLGDLVLTCAVLPDGMRVLSERGISRALGRTRSGSHWQKKREQGADLPLYLTSDNLKPFIPNDLIKALSSPIWYRPTHGGRLVAGIPAPCLSDICDAWTSAEAAGKLYKSQFGIAAKARMLMRAFQKLGIIALIDEATGYQEVRAKDELQKILAAYISPTLLPWAERFPIDFFKEMFRLYGWAWPYNSDNDYRGPKGPRYAGKLVRAIIFDNLPPGVLPEMDRLNPPNYRWQRKYRMGQLLTENIGHPHVEKLVAVATMLFRVSDSPEEFWKNYKRAFPKSGDQIELSLEQP
jgi:hypothetical protein